MSDKLFPVDGGYEGEPGTGLTMRRESDLTPNGNPFWHSWVLRRHGVFVDYDFYRNDLAERNKIQLVGGCHE